MEKKGLRSSPERHWVCNMCKVFGGGGHQPVGAAGFRWGTAILIVHAARCDGLWFWNFPFYMSRVERSPRAGRWNRDNPLGSITVVHTW